MVSAVFSIAFDALSGCWCCAGIDAGLALQACPRDAASRDIKLDSPLFEQDRWHVDCSIESAPDRLFILVVVYGGLSGHGRACRESCQPAARSNGQIEYNDNVMIFPKNPGYDSWKHMSYVVRFLCELSTWCSVGNFLQKNKAASKPTDVLAGFKMCTYGKRLIYHNLLLA